KKIARLRLEPLEPRWLLSVASLHLLNAPNDHEAGAQVRHHDAEQPAVGLSDEGIQSFETPTQATQNQHDRAARQGESAEEQYQPPTEPATEPAQGAVPGNGRADDQSLEEAATGQQQATSGQPATEGASKQNKSQAEADQATKKILEGDRKTPKPP